MDTDYLRPIELCQKCELKEAKFVIIGRDGERDIACCENWKNDTYTHHSTEPIPDKSDIKQSIADAK